MKFKENDRIKVTSIRDNATIYDIEPSYLIGKTGTIVSIDYIPETNSNIDCPYEIRFDDHKAQESGNAFWEESEIELIEEVVKVEYPFNIPNDRNISDAFYYLKSKGVTPEIYAKLWDLWK